MTKKRKTRSQIQKRKLKKTLTILKALSKINPKCKEAKSFINKLNKSNYKNFCDCLYNVIYNPHILPKATKKRLKNNMFKKQKRIHNFLSKNYENKKECYHLLPYFITCLKPLCCFIRKII